MKTALVCLSGGLDSTVAFMWANKNYDHVDCITFIYGQVAADAEVNAAMSVSAFGHEFRPGTPHRIHKILELPNDMFAGKSSILGRSQIDQYQTVEQAVQNTPNDRSYIPLRNAIFITVAAHHMLSRFPAGGSVVIGTRSRSDPGAPAGYPDCTAEFADRMTWALTQGAGTEVHVVDPLNRRPVPSREDTIRYAMDMDENALEYLARTVTCFSGTRCGKCLPCQRRRQAFAAVGIEDPAIEYSGRV